MSGEAELRQLLAAHPVDVYADSHERPRNDDRVTVWRRHECHAKHRTTRTFLQCAIPRVAWVCGEGEYASVAWCGVPTVFVFETYEEAVQAKAGIDFYACGSKCRNRHQIIRVVLP